MTARPKPILFGFGGNGKRSAYIDDKHYAAIESVEGTSVLNYVGENGPVNYDNVTATSYLVSSDQLNVTKFFRNVGPAATSRYASNATSCNGAPSAHASYSATMTGRSMSITSISAGGSPAT